ncbi:hypothetical protein OG320_15565 [Microbispora sp. NBC_01189]|uniref:hypothetical protein n=1 Tax=Microbispora sp. NBC_01189 TaxID=2903583 RepID=UPI002E10F0D5|nr:hypothetical protein OG320_15565 [Microbispora sp. NBC_01189]
MTTLARSSLPGTGNRSPSGKRNACGRTRRPRPAWWSNWSPAACLSSTPATWTAADATRLRWTTTCDVHNGGRRIGLHVDNFDRLPYPGRLRSRRRLCLNLGPGTRWLLVCDCTITGICRALGRDQAGHLPHTDDVRAYVTGGHPLRCLRIRLEPGEGYIAPTEILPHDGSTADADTWSCAAFWLGYPSRNATA